MMVTKGLAGLVGEAPELFEADEEALGRLDHPP
jgi:hypothetical protein